MPKENFKPLADIIDKINERIKNTPEKPQPIQRQVPQVEPKMSLELWPNAVRSVPNTILRSSLFSINQRRLIAKKRELLATLEGIEIRFKGEKFNQTDLDVWEMLLHLARQHPLGNQVEFSAHSFLKELGRGTSGKHHEELKEEFSRLLGGVVEITWTKEGKTFIGHLVEKAYRDEITQRYVVAFDQKMLCLYEGGYSHVDWEQRNALGNNSLAKWLHGFYASHAAPFPYKVETIRTLCGSSNGELRGFRRDLKIALTELVEVGAIVSWEINKNDLVIIVKIPTSSQKKYMKNCKQ
jgi:TrfA protein